ncbi:MAG: hypothetical protein ACRCW9_04040 [Cetobacterium sp.]
MDLKNKAIELRKKLKNIGYTSKQISVTSKHSLRVVIKDLNISKSEIEKMAIKYEKIRYCTASGEMLQGCNDFVDVQYDRDLISNEAIKYYELSEKVIKDGENCTYFINIGDDIKYGNQKSSNTWGHLRINGKIFPAYDKIELSRSLVEIISDFKINI